MSNIFKGHMYFLLTYISDIFNFYKLSYSAFTDTYSIPLCQKATLLPYRLKVPRVLRLTWLGGRHTGLHCLPLELWKQD